MQRASQPAANCNFLFRGRLPRERNKTACRDLDRLKCFSSQISATTPCGTKACMAPSSLPVSGPGYHTTSWSLHNGLLRDVESQSVAASSDSGLKLENDDEVRATFVLDLRRLEDQCRPLDHCILEPCKAVSHLFVSTQLSIHLGHPIVTH